MKKRGIAWAAMVLSSAAWATVYPMLGGPGLVHLQSAKTGQGIGYRSISAFSSYSGLNYYGTSGSSDVMMDIWSYNTVSYGITPRLSVIGTGLAHAEQWSIKNDVPVGLTADKTLGCPGDAMVAVKYQLPLADGKWDLGLMPMITIPMSRDKYADGPSQTGKVDFGGKLLTDINWERMVLLVNTGFLTRGEERPQMPLGLGLEYGLNDKFSAFFEASGEYRLGTAKDSVPNELLPKGRGADRHEFRITPGLRFSPLAILGLNLSCDIGLTSTAAPWQVALGLDLPAAAGRTLARKLTGIVAGLIKDNASGLPIKGIISFPNQNIAAVISDAAGNYRISLKPGKYKIQVKADGFRAITREIEVKPGTTSNWDLGLNRKMGRLTILTSDASNKQPVSALLSFEGNKIPAAKTDPAKGEYQASVPPGNYNLTISATGYQTQTISLSIGDREGLVKQAALVPLVAPVQPPKPVAPATSVAGISKPNPAASKVKPKDEAPAPKSSAAVPKMSAEEISLLYKQGVQQFMNEEYQKAEQTFKKVLAADPGHTKAKDYLGKTRERLKKSKG